MKFKVGDKVKIKDEIEYNYHISNIIIEKLKNKILTIESCEKDKLGNWYKIVEDTMKFNWHENNLEFVESRNKFKIGQMVKIKRTGEIKKIVLIHDVDYNAAGASNICYKLENLYYYTVHDLEEVEEILDEKEKEYLKSVIKPFRKYVNYIEKFGYEDSDKEYIKIAIKKEDEEIINLPYFEKNSMYNNMESRKKYTLEELGL